MPKRVRPERPFATRASRCDAAGKTRVSCYYRAIRPTFDDNHELPQLAFRKSVVKRHTAKLLALAAAGVACAAAVAMHARRCK
jgi:hypothetical protein